MSKRGEINMHIQFYWIDKGTGRWPSHTSWTIPSSKALSQHFELYLETVWYPAALDVEMLHGCHENVHYYYHRSVTEKWTELIKYSSRVPLPPPAPELWSKGIAFHSLLKDNRDISSFDWQTDWAGCDVVQVFHAYFPLQSTFICFSYQYKLKILHTLPKASES